LVGEPEIIDDQAAWLVPEEAVSKYTCRTRCNSASRPGRTMRIAYWHKRRRLSYINVFLKAYATLHWNGSSAHFVRGGSPFGILPSSESSKESGKRSTNYADLRFFSQVQGVHRLRSHLPFSLSTVRSFAVNCIKRSCVNRSFNSHCTVITPGQAPTFNPSLGMLTPFELARLKTERQIPTNLAAAGIWSLTIDIKAAESQQRNVEHSSVLRNNAGRFEGVRTLTRAFAILEALSRDGSGLSLSQLCVSLGLKKSTGHRLLGVLERHQFVTRDPVSGSYQLGLKLFELGSKSLARLDLRDQARPFLARLVALSGETAHLSVLAQGEVLYLDRIEPERSLRMPSAVGSRSPVHCTAAGKALMALLSEENRIEIIQRHGLKRYTPATITSARRLERELISVRRVGYAVDLEEFETGLRAVGAALFDAAGQPAGAISIAGPSSRLTRRRIAKLGILVARTAQQLSVALGAHSGDRMSDGNEPSARYGDATKRRGSKKETKEDRLWNGQTGMDSSGTRSWTSTRSSDA
jgi:IclR family KDG regulon transcriptional repressor